MLIKHKIDCDFCGYGYKLGPQDFNKEYLDGKIQMVHQCKHCKTESRVLNIVVDGVGSYLTKTQIDEMTAGNKPLDVAIRHYRERAFDGK